MSAEDDEFVVKVRLLPDDILERYKNDPVFNYDNNQKEAEDWITKIKNQQIASAFQNTTFRFEWIWYGDFPVDKDILKNSQSDFNKLFELIKFG